MATKFVFADESGNFDFSRTPGATRHYILTTVTADDCACGASLLDLRHELAARGIGLDRDEFHATEDMQSIRDEVFDRVKGMSIRVDATIIEKSKAEPRIRSSDARFYQYAWFYHMKYLAPRICGKNDTLVVVGAALQTKRKRQIFHSAIRDVMYQTSPTVQSHVAFWSAQGNPCLQVADYCCWAFSRKWERNDGRSHLLIQPLIASEFDLFQSGRAHHY